MTPTDGTKPSTGAHAPIPAPPVPISTPGAPPAPKVPTVVPPVPKPTQGGAPPSAPHTLPPAPQVTDSTTLRSPRLSPSAGHPSLSARRARSSSSGAGHTGAPTEKRTPLPAGTKVGDYIIASNIGIGGFGIVYIANHAKDGTRVALKEHMPEGLAYREPNSAHIAHPSPEAEDRFNVTLDEFIEEVTVLMAVSHPGIIPILSAFVANGTAYYVMPYMDGTPMSIIEQASLDQTHRAQVARHNKRLLLSMLSILDYLRMHQIVHRDIKPENILVTETGSCILLDFGSARQLQPDKVFTNVYTPDFCAPEQSRAETDAEMSANIGPWTDLYALGASFYYLITHIYPPRADLRVISSQDPYSPLINRADLVALYGAPFLRAIDRAMELKTGDRWQSAAAWRIAIGEGAMPTAPAKARRIRTATICTTAALAVLSSVCLWALYEKHQATRAFDNSMTFVENLLTDFNQEIADIPGSTHLQRILSGYLRTYLNNMDSPDGVTDEKLIRSLTTSWHNYAAVCMQQGKLEEADKACERVISYLHTLIKENPEHRSHKYDLATELLTRVQIARSRNNAEQVHSFLSEAMNILDTLCVQVPSNPDFQCAMGLALGEEAMQARVEGRTDACRKSLSSALNLFRDLYYQYPDHVKVMEGLGYALQNCAQYLNDQMNPVQAITFLDESRTIFSTLTTRFPYRLSFQKGHAQSYYSMGLLYGRMGEITKDATYSRDYDQRAMNALQTYLDLISKLESQDENKVEYPFMECRALTAMVDILLRDDQPNLAEAHCNTIMRKITPLRETAPDNADYAILEATAWRGLAMAHSRSARYATKAANEFTKYREQIEHLLKAAPEHATLQYLYIDALVESAAHAHITGQVVQARRWLLQAQSDLLKLLRSDSTNSLYTSKLEKVQKQIENLPPAPPTSTTTPPAEN